MEARRCAAHGLIVGEDGRCVVCRRGEIDSKPATSSDLPVVVFVVVMGAIVTAALGYALTRKIASAVAEREQPVVVAPPPEEPADEPEPEPVRKTSTRKDFPSILDTARPPSSEPVPPSEEELEKAKRQVPITMYARPDCSLCDSARIFLRQRGYRLKELDISKSETDKVLLQSVNPAGTVPTFDVAGKTLVGYDRSVLDEAIAAAATPKKK